MKELKNLLIFVGPSYTGNNDINSFVPKKSGYCYWVMQKLQLVGDVYCMQMGYGGTTVTQGPQFCGNKWIHQSARNIVRDRRFDPTKNYEVTYQVKITSDTKIYTIFNFGGNETKDWGNLKNRFVSDYVSELNLFSNSKNFVCSTPKIWTGDDPQILVNEKIKEVVQISGAEFIDHSGINKIEYFCYATNPADQYHMNEVGQTIQADDVFKVVKPAIFGGTVPPIILIGEKMNKIEYKDKLKGFWAGNCIGVTRGVPAECHFIKPPFLTDADDSKYPYIFPAIWDANDDNWYEYMYLHLMIQHNTTTLSATQIRDGWVKYFPNGRMAKEIMSKGLLPPDTGKAKNNEHSDEIDAQITTEFFGLLAPTMVNKAQSMARLPILTVGETFAADAAQFYVAMHSFALKYNSILEILDNARKTISSDTRTSKIYDFIRVSYLANSDKSNWEKTRDDLWYKFGDNNAEYLHTVESSINFGATCIALLYGNLDFKKTVSIGVLAGWDCDCNAATVGGLVGFIKGFNYLKSIFGNALSSNYRVKTIVPTGVTEFFDTIADRMIKIIDKVIIEEGGTVTSTEWIFKTGENNSMVPIATIKDKKLYSTIITGADKYAWQCNKAPSAFFSFGNPLDIPVDFQVAGAEFWVYAMKAGKRISEDSIHIPYLTEQPPVIIGCMDSKAKNYNPLATKDTDPTSCIYDVPSVGDIIEVNKAVLTKIKQDAENIIFLVNQELVD